MLSPPPVGASVTISALNARRDLNGSSGVVLSYDGSTGRAAVRITNEPGPLALKLANITLLDPEASPLPPASDPRHADLCLTRTVLYDKLSFYYAFGNTPPTYVLPGVAAPSDDVLLLASGDVRSALYSLVRDTRQIRFFANDADPHVVARNVVLIWLAHRADAAHVFAIWFSLGLSDAAHASLRQALAALLGERAEDEMAAVGVAFHRREDREAVEAVLRSWESWRLEWDVVQAAREKKLWASPLLIQSSAGSLREAGRAFATAKLARHRIGNKQLPLEVAEEEWATYFESGYIVALGEEALGKPTNVNPTLFQSATSYDLHYASCPYAAFPLYVAEYDARRPLTTACQKELETWLVELRERGRGVRWVFAVDDCLRLCSSLVPRQFAVVGSSNVADHVGLFPLLQAARMVVKADGILITSTMLHLSYSDDVEDYLKAHLMLEPELWPGVIGWRCLGFEGSLAPVSAQVQLVMPDIFAHISKSAGRQKDPGLSRPNRTERGGLGSYFTMVGRRAQRNTAGGGRDFGRFYGQLSP